MASNALRVMRTSPPTSNVVGRFRFFIAARSARRGLQCYQPLHQAVVRGIRNLRLVQNVIEIFVMAQLVAQLFDLVFGGYRLGHGTLVKNLRWNSHLLYRMELSRRG